VNALKINPKERNLKQKLKKRTQEEKK